jgi:hypothetical protein
MHPNAALGSSCGAILHWLHRTSRVCGGRSVIHEVVYYYTLHTAALQKSIMSGFYNLQVNARHGARLLHRHLTSWTGCRGQRGDGSLEALRFITGGVSLLSNRYRRGMVPGNSMSWNTLIIDLLCGWLSETSTTRHCQVGQLEELERNITVLQSFLDRRKEKFGSYFEGRGVERSASWKETTKKFRMQQSYSRQRTNSLQPISEIQRRHPMCLS